MIRFLVFFSLAYTLTGCGTSYNYYAPLVNNIPFAGKGETHISGNVGTSGPALKLGYSFGDKLGLSAVFQKSAPLKYHGSEMEAALGFCKHDTSISSIKKIISAGCGIGTNYEKTPYSEIRNFRGSYSKPFIMLTIGTANKSKSMEKFLFRDAAFSLKANYLIYNGFKGTTINNIPSEKKFNTAVFFAEPGINLFFGTQYLRIDLGLGALIKKKYDFEKNIAIFPFEANAGLLFIVGRKINN